MSNELGLERAGQPASLLLRGRKGARSAVSSHPQLKLNAKAGVEPEWIDPGLFSDAQKDKVRIMGENGIEHPVYVMQVCIAADLPLFFECAFLQHESFGGKNVWHNDATWLRGQDLRPLGLEKPSKELYEVYKLYRNRFGFQGIGPNALTHPSWQDRGDFYGGAYLARSNMLGACSYFRERLDAGETMDDIAHNYNPGSPTYLETHKEFRRTWKNLLT